jgi:hypothetical protein
MGKVGSRLAASYSDVPFLCAWADHLSTPARHMGGFESECVCIWEHLLAMAAPSVFFERPPAHHRRRQNGLRNGFLLLTSVVKSLLAVLALECR